MKKISVIVSSDEEPVCVVMHAEMDEETVAQLRDFMRGNGVNFREASISF